VVFALEPASEERRDREPITIERQMIQKGILQVEDDENDVFLLRTVFERAGITTPLHVVTDGQMAIDYLGRRGEFADSQKYPFPCLVLTDLNLPKRSGMEVLQWIRHHPRLKKLVVVVFSSSALPRDVDLAYELGANAYIQKSADLNQLTEIASLLKGWWLGYNHFAPIVDSRMAEVAGMQQQIPQVVRCP
jgi:CheY-like chemotaxis protein